MNVSNDKAKSRARQAAWYARNIDEARRKKRENMKRYRSENPEKYREQSRRAKYRLREKLAEVFGRLCVICGFSDTRALTLDHILNNGAEERREIGERGVYYRALKPKHQHEYRVLCMNCQFITRHDGGRQNQHQKKLHDDDQQWLHSHGQH